MNYQQGIHQHMVLILGLLLSFQNAYGANSNGTQAHLQTRAITHPLLADPTNTQDVIRVFASLTSSEFRTWLNAELPPPPPIDELAFARAAQQAQINIVSDPDTCTRLQQQAQPILKLFKRDQNVRFVVYYDSYPQLQTLAHNNLAVSTGLLQILKSDVQLNGLIAHELARDIRMTVYHSAWADHDLQRLRQMELFYDAVATLALQATNFSPEDYAAFLQRIIKYNFATSSSNNTHQYNRHPTLQDRQRVIRQIDLKQSPEILDSRTENKRRGPSEQ
jgi:hypothetical protein